MRTLYPKPKPYQVLGITASDWNYPGRGRPVPTREEFDAYMAGLGEVATEGQYEDWKSKVEAAKRANVSDDTKGTTPDAAQPLPEPVPTVPTPVPSVEPALPFTGLPHQQARPTKAAMEVMSVRVREGLNGRLDRYRVSVGASKQDVVSDVLHDFLTRQGF